ncbi:MULTISPECIES: hypothetical protein [unclassified Mesorhizobium]|uniref:hypothetical protein n=1 Tax=unclassified Mesorhizobium TaxID=325217 RepID=UPI0003CF12C6|nr:MULTISPECIES: hypothetical protein [unclassified Mesorhizobium]ESY07267.1 hypothetical protein X753_00055 [Mesorhizobium sp. LNJC399B00]ESY23303.1 hypothetical protein X750_09605 [Mesorhizobium sp. LNJC394B00]ESY51381.1 hypothetical protein X745_24180 [Mesorhizobium sp. LNJC374B00]ESY56663.1 hypothetical protein X744_20800 [Mesorhizobium sp. LNJC372A00]ESZ43541.1 hypothetical protein X730_27480 [Mesorhizobium sp. L103C565B0]
MDVRAKCLVTAFALSVIGGSAFAGALDVIDPINQLSFSHTSSIKRQTHTDPVMRSRFRAALGTLPMGKRKAMIRECQDAGMTKPYAEFCADLNALGQGH